MSRGGHGLAYVVKSTRIPGGFRPAAHVACAGAGCSVVEPLLMANHSNNPEWVAERMRARGWACDGFHAGRNRCPACIAAQSSKRRGEQPGAKFVASPVQPRGETMTSATRPPPLAIVPAPATDLSVVPPDSWPPGGKPPSPSVEQKAAIRRELDGAFDERLGRYLDGQSDHAIAERLKLPRQMVAHLRETAYGPIRSMPELEALGAEQASLSERVATLQREAGALADQARDLGGRILALARQHGIDAAALSARPATASGPGPANGQGA